MQAMQSVLGEKLFLNSQIQSSEDIFVISWMFEWKYFILFETNINQNLMNLEVYTIGDVWKK